LRKGTWHKALGTIFIIIALFPVADKLFIVDFRPFLFFEKFRKNPNKKAAFGVSAPKTAGGNIILFVSVLFPPAILAQKVWERKLLWDFFIFSGLEGLTPRPSTC
jgi:hypothetical protein